MDFGGCGSVCVCGVQVKVNLQSSDRRLAIKPADILIMCDSLGCKEPREHNSEISNFTSYLQSGPLTWKT